MTYTRPSLSNGAKGPRYTFAHTSLTCTSATNSEENSIIWKLKISIDLLIVIILKGLIC